MDRRPSQAPPTAASRTHVDRELSCQNPASIVVEYSRSTAAPVTAKTAEPDDEGFLFTIDCSVTEPAVMILISASFTDRLALRGK